MKQLDVVVIGAGAAGLMCAAQAGYRGRSVLVLDNAKKPGRKILISGGGRCNFTNHQAGPHAFLSANPHFCKSALARYTQQDFIDLVDRHRHISTSACAYEREVFDIGSERMRHGTLNGINPRIHRLDDGITRTKDIGIISHTTG